MMSLPEYAFVYTLMLTAFPFSMTQMGTALDQEDIESFCLWLFFAAALAGLPFMTTALAPRWG